MTSDAWPFGTDAKQDDPLTKLRIPVVTSFNPEWKYVATFIDVDTSRYSWGSGERPTDAEAVMLASFIEEYKHHWFRESYHRKLAQRPLDVDSGCNTTIFIKYGTDDWGYRMCSWQYGPMYVPVSPKQRGGERDYDKCPGPLTLEQVMDRRHTIGDGPMKHWLDWKAQHPEVFPVSVPEGAA
ncbi:hypothetical protein [Streptomyces sp. NBC_01422]|uniref:hypothetical protein n=1 Tax=Streptomyces sp. NBC_01422 TaxID=2903859 RepID=UPI002E2E787F|nr:hypothetical protein [Streptomyces sp. NBC_01422]